MNENINLSEILKGHEGETFYSPLCGKIVLNEIADSKFQYPICFTVKSGCTSMMQTFSSDGRSNKSNTECLVFPSKNQRDWNIWLEEQNSKDPKTWNDLVKSEKYHCNTIKIDHNGDGYAFPGRDIEKSALALLKIYQLIEVGYGGNVTNDEWDDTDMKKWYITPNVLYFFNEEIFDIVYAWNRSYKRVIAFHTGEQAKEFLKYPENVQLLKDYFMIN